MSSRQEKSSGFARKDLTHRTIAQDELERQGMEQGQGGVGAEMTSGAGYDMLGDVSYPDDEPPQREISRWTRFWHWLGFGPCICREPGGRHCRMCLKVQAFG